MSTVAFPFGPYTVAREGGLLFLFDMANSHQGSMEHGLKIIEAIAAIAREKKIAAAIKFQFRQLKSFLHPGFLEACLPNSSNKHTKRFLETQLTFEDYQKMVECVRKNGLTPFATPFDEASVDWCDRLDLPVIKVASCSADDWPLLRRIAESKRPVVCSTGGLLLRQIDEVVSFFSRREIPLAIMHCVGIYPVPWGYLQMDQVRQLRRRYGDLVIGYSAHESEADLDAVTLAVASGAALLERHVGLPAENISLNSYSLGPEAVKRWVDSALRAKIGMNIGKQRLELEQESKSMRELKRGIYARVEKKPGEYLSSEDLMLAMPCQSGQFHAGELDEVVGLPVSHRGIEPMMPVMKNGTCEVAPEVQISSILERVRLMLREAKIALPPGTRVEISHPYGLEVVKKYGAVMIDIVNREYCKKLIVQLAGQAHPRHKHVQKEETFQVLAGEGEAEVDGKVSLLRPGDSILINRSVEHSFRTRTGMIMEEISTTHIRGDSIYEDRNIPSNPVGRKTLVPI